LIDLIDIDVLGGQVVELCLQRSQGFHAPPLLPVAREDGELDAKALELAAADLGALGFGGAHAVKRSTSTADLARTGGRRAFGIFRPNTPNIAPCPCLQLRAVAR
jgi:hypothetical protein